MAQPQENFAVTKIVDGEETLVFDGLTFGDAFGRVMKLRRVMWDTREYERKLGMPDDEHYWYYRMGRPH